MKNPQHRHDLATATIRHLATAGAVLTFALTASTAIAQTTIDGSIGAAKRYRATPMSATDVVLADTRLQDVLQSDTFDRLVRDGRAREALSEPALRSALTAGVDGQYVFKPIDKMTPKFSASQSATDVQWVFKLLDKMTPKFSAIGDAADLTAGLKMLTSQRECVEKARNIASGLR